MFHSIQGEGLYSGLPMFFVRTNRCNLRCTWCDTTYSFNGGSEIDLNELVTQAASTWEEWICFTGGEPLIQAEALKFMEGVSAAGKKILVETSGSINIGKFATTRNVFFDMDIKTPSSGEESSLFAGNLGYLKQGDYVKFVIKDQGDYDFAVDWLGKLGRIDAVFQPCGGADLKWLVESAIKDGINVRVLPQLHKLIWGERKGV